jgi:hypothetical protein
MVQIRDSYIIGPASASTEKFLDGLETLAETFGGSEALFQTIAEMRKGRVEGRIKPNSR